MIKIIIFFFIIYYFIYIIITQYSILKQSKNNYDHML